MGKIKKAIRLLLTDHNALMASIIHNLSPFIKNDKTYLKLLYRYEMGRRLDLRDPKSFNEKIQWLKLYYRKPEFVTMVDKYAVKDYVSQIIGPEHVLPTLGVWDSPEMIEWEKLPKQFVLKTTDGGGGGGVLICRDKYLLDTRQAVLQLKSASKLDIYREYREWPYKNVPRRVFAEPYIESQDGELRDYKFFCFNGKVRMFKIDFNRFIKHRANYYNEKGVLLHFGEANFPPDYNKEILMPENIGTMIRLAENLSSNLPFVRIDLYNCDGDIYFGEITFYPASGMGRFTSEDWDNKIGQMLVLPKMSL